MNKKILMFELIILLLFISLSYFYYADKTKKIEQNIYKQKSLSIKNELKKLIKEKTVSTNSLSFVLSKDDRVIKALLKNDNSFIKYDEIIDGLKQKSKFKNIWIQVINKDGFSFYRSWTKKRGDFIVKERKDIAVFLKNPKPMTHISSGKFDLTFKFMEPVYFKGKFLGIVEIITKFNSVANGLVEHDINPLILVNKTFSNRIKIPFTKTFINGNYVANLNASKELMNLVKTEGLEYFHNINDYKLLKGYLVTTYMLRSMDHKHLGHALLFYKQDKINMSKLKSFQLYFSIFIITFIIINLIILWLFLLSSRAKILKKFNEQVQEDKKALKESQDYLQAIYDAAPSIFITTNGSKMDNANNMMLDFTGYASLDDFLQDHDCICDLFLKEDGYIQSEMNGLSWLEYINQNIKLVHKVKMMKDSKVYAFLIIVKNINFDLNRSLVVFADITDLEELGRRLEYAVGGTSDGLWDRDLISNDVYYSPRWKSMLGYEDDELKNDFDTWIELIHPDDLESATDHMSDSYKHPEKLYESIYRLKHKDGSWVWILDRAQIILNENSKPIRMVGFHTDITEIKKLEKELGDKEEIMIAQSRHAAMGEMIGMIAHQWRQPISVIAMDANNILTDIELEMIDNESLKSDSEDILKQTQELSKTINDFRNFFRPSKTKDIVLIEDIIDDALGVIGSSLENNNIEVVLDLGKSIKVETFSRELMQVIINIIKNAKEALLEKEIEKGNIIISLKEKKNSLNLRICDNARGVPDDVIKKIFEPYFSTKGEKDGTGLGLYMSKTIIDKHIGGTLSVYNLEEGACFELKLPISIKVIE